VDDISEMSKQMRRLLQNTELYQTLSSKGRQYVCNNCVRSKVIQQLADFIK
jgi:glycosyltransferase involved in cell wall biosynthesis